MARAMVPHGSAWVPAGKGDLIDQATEEVVVNSTAMSTTVTYTNQRLWQDFSSITRQGDGSWIGTIPPVDPNVGNVQVRHYGVGWADLATLNSRQVVANRVNSAQASYQLLHGYCAIEVMHSGRKVGFSGYSRNGRYRIKADGKPLPSTGGPLESRGFGSDGNNVTVSVEFAEAKTRRIRLEYGTGWFPYGVRCDGGEALWLPEYVRRPRIMWMGDSYVYGGNSPSRGFRDFVHQASAHLGSDEIIMDALGGTGYVKTNAVQTPPWENYADRFADNHGSGKVQTDWIDALVICGSINDNAQTNPVVLAAAQSVFAQAATLQPGVPVFVVSMGTNAGVANSTVARANQVRIAAEAAPNVESYLNLTYSLSGVYLDDDNTHPSQAGHDRYAEEVAEWLSPYINALELA